MIGELSIMVRVTAWAYEVPWREGRIDWATLIADYRALMAAGVSQCFLDMATLRVVMATEPIS